ncbi:AfsR/SARP family transcriptional regulator [Actinophytocola glycyrrhizae]|uniref:BTAD domain-containing putative transcriptional regulator n=1 Tax=Actinophytocola glycyrrhizae TaxID=2044873 RepID=A0ABV9SG60_9PSEU
MFHLYGTVGPAAHGVAVEFGPERERRMLVPLLLTRGKAVSRLELTEWMWDDAPESASADLEQHLTALRRGLAALGFRQTLVNRDQVCRLTIPPDRVDAHRLAAVVAESSRLDDRTAARRLRAALDLCAGHPLAGLTGRRIDRCRHTLLEERRTAKIALIRAEFRLGRAEQHVPDLLRLSHERLADSEVVGLAVSALRHTGRQAEAAELYDRFREHLIELGMSMPKRMLDLRPRTSHVESH